MSTEGKMYCGHTPESDLPLGMVTRVDKEKEFIYVWGLSMGTSEIRFPLASKPDIEPGTLVNYHLGQDRRGVQYQKDIYVNRSHRLIIRRFDEGYVRKHGISYSVKTTIIFPPPTYEPYIKVLEKVNDHTGCYGVGFSPEYGQVGCFASRLKFKPGVVYDTYVCRMPSNTPPDLVAALGSFFIASAKDGLVPNPNKQEEVSAQAPWNHIKNLGASGVSGQPSNVCYEEDQQEEYEEEDDVREYESNRYQRQAVMSRSSSRAGPVSKRGSERGHIYPTRTTESVADKGSNLPIYQGIVVRLEEDYFIIWSHDHGTVCALHRRNNEFPPLATWVNYCCHKDIIPLEEEDRGITQSAFRVKEIEPMRLSCALESTVQVQAKVWMSEDKTSVLNDSFILVEDELLGPILCPRDNFLLRILKAGNTADIYVVFIEEFLKQSKWFAVAVDREKEDWCKLNNLPARVEELAAIAFDEWRNKGEDYKNAACNRRSANDEENINRNINEGRTYAPPPGYNGYVRLSSRKISEVLGLVVEKEEDNQVSVIYTIFGLARVQSDYELGTWLKTSIIEDDEENPMQTTFSDAFSKRYQVYKCDKISPPMSTRVISSNGMEKIMLCGIVNWDNDCLLNDYLGVIEDRKGYLEYVNASTTGYLVEFGLAHRKSTGALYFTLLKYHGAAVKNHNWVPLEMSFYNKDLGRTMDDPHTILLDAHYTDPRPLDNDQFSSRQVSPSRDLMNSSNNFRPGFGLGYARGEEEQEETGSMYTCRSVPRGDMVISRFGQRRNTAESMLARPQRRRQIEQGLEERDEEVDQELPYIQPASRPMSTLPSTSAVVAKPIKNFDYLSEETGKVDLDSQLHLYRAEPADTKKRSIGLVVRKFANCALLFSQKAGLVLIKSSAFENDQQFDFECSMGNWLAGVFTRAQNAHQLPYKFMCMDRIQQTHGPLETRVVGQFVQVLLPNISFNEDTVSKCAIDPTRLKVQTVVGDVSVEASLYTKNELHNSTRSFWVVFTQQQHECFWKLKWPTIIEQTTEQLSEEDHEVCVALSNSCSKSNQAVRGTRHYSFEDDEETGYYDCPSRLPELADQPTPTISETQYSVTPSPPACPSPDLLSFEPVAAPVYQKEEPQTKSQTASLQPVERQISKLKNPKYVSLAELALDELAELGKKQKSAENVQEEETIPKRVVSEAGESADKRTSSIPMTYLKQWHEEQSRVKDSTATDLDAKCIGGSGKNGKSEFEAKKSTTTQSTNSDSFMEVDSHGSLSMQYIASSSNPSPNSDKLTNKSTKQFSSSSASSSAQEDKPAGEYDLVNDPAITCHTDDSWPSDYSGCFSSTGGVYKHNVVDPMHEEGLQDFIGRYAGEDADKIIQYASSSNCSSPEVQEHDDEPALGNGFGAHTPSTGSHESDHELDEQMAGEDNIRLINFDEEVESVASVGTTPHVSEQLFGEDIFSSKASCLDLMADSTKFFETLMAANRHGRTSPKLHNEQGKLKGGNTDIYVHNPNDTELWLNTVFVTSVVVLLAYFYWTLIDFFNSFSSESFQHTPRT